MTLADIRARAKWWPLADDCLNVLVHATRDRRDLLVFVEAAIAHIDATGPGVAPTWQRLLEARRVLEEGA
jgi:hypothetical protein